MFGEGVWFSTSSIQCKSYSIDEVPERSSGNVSSYNHHTCEREHSHQTWSYKTAVSLLASPPGLGGGGEGGMVASPLGLGGVGGGGGMVASPLGLRGVGRDLSLPELL